MKPPILMVMAGPNGSGKSTITAEYTPIGAYINADEIQRHLNCNALEAAQIAEATREYMLRNKEDFTFETLLSTERNYNLMARAKEEGYHVICIYVLTNDAEINVSRVKMRVEKGGHDVPEEKIRLRYFRAMKLFPKLFNVCDELYVYDNSDDRTKGTSKMILMWRQGELEFYPQKNWSQEMLMNLCKGTYNKQ